MLERETELSQVSEALRHARAGRGSLLVVGGPVGNGKSAFLDALPPLATEHGARVLRASGAVSEQRFPFGVVRQLLDPAKPQGLSGRPPSVKDRIGAMPCERPEIPDPVELTSDRQPLLVLVDNVHAADQPSQRWLGQLARRLDGTRAVLVVTVRDGDPQTELPLARAVTDLATGWLRPSGLSVPACRLLVEAHFDGPVQEEFVLACHEASGGNPMVLKATLLAAAAAGHRPVAEEAARIRALRPPALSHRFLSCLQTYPEHVRRLCQAVLVLGQDADPELLDRLCDLDPAGRTEAIRLLRRAGLLTDEPRLRFSHHAVGAAVEHSASVAEVERLHTKVAALLYQGGHPAERVAAHLLAVTAPQEDWTTDVLRSAADSALRRGDPESAARYLRRALLACGPEGPGRAELLMGLANAEQGFDTGAAMRHALQATHLLDTPAGRARAAASIGLLALGRTSSRTVEQVRRIAGEHGEPERLRGADREAALRLEARLRHASQFDPGRLDEAVDRLGEFGDRPPMDTRSGRELTATLLYAGMLTGRLTAVEVARLGTRILDREPASPDHAHTATPLVVTALLAADRAPAVCSWLELSVSESGKQQAPVSRAIACAELARAMCGLGRVAAAVPLITEALELLDPEWIGGDLLLVGVLASIIHESAVPDPELIGRISTMYFPADNDPHTALTKSLAAGAQAAGQGNSTEAIRHLRDCGRMVERLGWRNPAVLPWRSWAAAHHLKLGQTGDASELIDEELVLAERWGAPTAIGRALRIRGGMESGETGVKLLREAVEVLGGSPNALELARACLSLGNRLRADGQADAAELLRRGNLLAAECGATLLPEQGSQAGPATDSRPLTGAEHRVAVLAVTGRTNQDIAEVLGVRSRTVEKHLTRVYRKLGVSGRSGLDDALRALAPDVNAV
ncbi:AAA family ATPase [Amycolatopsis coloradensis]|uniref:helix-turn-helix transcriptional regulator n=1 Tax=Amycolatopsis coloradensis TaxID=76021 RepID=UPI0033D57A34